MLEVREQKLFITATDLEIELVGCLFLENAAEPGKTTVNAKKLTDICRTLPSEAIINLSKEKNRMILKSGKSRFTLATLNADDFPNTEENKEVSKAEFSLKQNELKKLLEMTHFSMAQQDVRYFLNGMFFHINQGFIKAVAADGHRLALASISDENINENVKVIVPRKGIIELMRLLEDTEDKINFSITANHICISSKEFTLTSKLIEGEFPDYEQSIYDNEGGECIKVNRENLKQALIRVSILSNEKYRGIRALLTSNLMKFSANNPEQEEAEEEIELNYQGPDLERGFNVAYLIDICNTLSSEEIKIMFYTNPNSRNAVLIEEDDNKAESNFQCRHIIMPMRI